MALSVLRPGAVVLDLSSDEDIAGPTDDDRDGSEEDEEEVHDAQVPSPEPAAQHIKQEQVEPAEPAPKKAKHEEQSEEAALTDGAGVSHSNGG